MFILLAGLILLFSPGSAAGQDQRITNETGMTFIRIQPGSFFMGSPKTEKYRDANEIRHKMVIQKPYYIQETEVTVAQWQAVMGKKWFMRKKGKPDMPVTRVSFYECEKFIKTLNEKSRYTYRLPTEAEWEYACRANTTTAYSWGENIDCSRAMYGNNVKKANECTIYYQTLQIPPDGPAPVKSFKPNPWGLYDMHGNVWEWCSDHYAEYMGPKHTGGMGHSMISSENRIRRGGSWYKYPQYLRSANRAYAHPGARFKTTGFRLVLEAQ
ncbi:MAG: formylglycine-generating enzyme family protein [Desulfobacterales bacterium]|nr:formylglycine-generating enzyme family protein [Desulfobacterales bacterium]